MKKSDWDCYRRSEVSRGAQGESVEKVEGIWREDTSGWDWMPHVVMLTVRVRMGIYLRVSRSRDCSCVVGHRWMRISWRMEDVGWRLLWKL